MPYRLKTPPKGVSPQIRPRLLHVVNVHTGSLLIGKVFSLPISPSMRREPRDKTPGLCLTLGRTDLPQDPHSRGGRCPQGSGLYLFLCRMSKPERPHNFHHTGDLPRAHLALTLSYTLPPRGYWVPVCLTFCHFIN